MLSVKGIYEKGKVTLLEPIPYTEKAEVIVTILSPPQPNPISFEKLDPKNYIQPLSSVLSLDPDEEELDEGEKPFSNVKDVNHFAKDLRQNSWRTGS